MQPWYYGHDHIRIIRRVNPSSTESSRLETETLPTSLLLGQTTSRKVGILQHSANTVCVQGVP